MCSSILLGSRYCDTDRLGDFAWSQFGDTPAGLAAGAGDLSTSSTTTSPSATRTPTRRAPPATAYSDRTGVCRDFAHLAITLCRCMNIPARYCTGYLGDIGVPPVPDPMDFSAWFEVYLGGRWHTFDARHNKPRIGRILMAIGRDATDVALSTSFGASLLSGFKVVTEEIDAEPAERRAQGRPRLRLATG